jgi:hypothetical protein
LSEALSRVNALIYMLVAWEWLSGLPRFEHA